MKKTYAGQLKEILILSWMLILPKLSKNDLETMKDQFVKMADHQIKEIDLIWADIQALQEGSK